MNNIEVTIKTPPTTSAEMRNVTLSIETKEFLVAHRMVQEAGDHALEQIEKFWGESFIDEATVPLWEAVDQLQEQILVLMTEVISEKLKDLEVTEI